MENRFSLGLEYLNTLRALRDNGTLLKAASARNITGPTAAAQLAALSKWVGAPLVKRKGRNVELTPQALILLEHGETVLAELERVQADLARFSEGDLGTVSIGSFAGAIGTLVIPSLTLLYGDRPGIKVHVEEIEAPECLRALDESRIDVAIAFEHDVSASDPENARYHRVLISRDPLRVAVSVRHHLAHRKTIALHELSAEKWIVGTRAQAVSDVGLAALTASSVTPTIAHRCDDWQSVMALVACGCGIALLPSIALGSARDDVVMLAIAPPEPVLNVCAVVRKGSEEAPHISALVESLIGGEPRNDLIESR